MQEKRSAARVPVQLSVNVEMDQEFYAGVTGDLGYGGVFVVSQTPPMPGTTVRLSIHLPDGSVVSAEGRVRWTRTPDVAEAGRPPGCGIGWRALDDKSTTAVRNFLLSRGVSLEE